MTRREARELAVQILYHQDLTGSGGEATWELAVEDQAVDEPGSAFARQLVAGVLERRPELDVLIKEALENWSFDRVSFVDRAILRLAIFELLYEGEDQVPAEVVIDEAIELGKTFSSSKAPSFINGVLGAVLRQLRDQQPAPVD